jgi:hypothetical protein
LGPIRHILLPLTPPPNESLNVWIDVEANLAWRFQFKNA